MSLGIVGKKIGMTQCFDSKGRVVPVTVVVMDPSVVVQKKSIQTDGYNSIQVGFGEIKPTIVNKPLFGHFKKHNILPKRYLKEIRIDDIAGYDIGQEIKVDIFQENELVDVKGISKGKGFAGVVKRWNFKGGKKSHGSMFHRAPGSIGQSSFPSRVWKNLRLPGRMGGENVVVQNVKVVKVDLENNLLLLKGAVPGHKDSMVFVQKAVKKKLKKEKHQ